MGGGGGKGGTSTSTVKIPKEVLARYNSVNKRAEDLASRPFQKYTGDFVAGINPQQEAGIAGINAAANAGRGYFDEAGGLIRAGSLSATPGELDINKYLSPYTENVVEATRRGQEQQNRQQSEQLAGNAISRGAFGGDRAGIAQANLSGQQSLANQQTLAQLRQQGYTQALGAAQQQQGLGYQAQAANLARQMQAGQNLAGLGAQAQTSGLQGAQAQIGAGTLQQQTEQADLSAQYNQFLQEQGYPFQIAQFLANIAMGTGALSGSTTTNVQPTSFFSDERLKEDIKPIGKTFDGQPIYSYRMKGDSRTQIGLLAQEVEGRHPEAVGLAKGYKTVDYDKATQGAAHRGHFYRGGLASSAGGGVSYGNAGEGFADGGVPIGGDIYQILAAQKAMFPYQNAGLYGGSQGMGPHGTAMPAVDIGDLTRAFESRQGTPPEQQESGFKQALNTGEQIANTYDRGQKVYEGANRALYGSPASAENKNKPTVGLLGSGGGEGTEPGLARQGIDAFTGLFTGKAHGGLVRPHYDMGGAMPYAQAQGSPLDDVLKDQEKSAPDAPEAAAPSGGGGQSGFQQALGTGAQIASIASLFAGSDRRMKEGIEPIGKTFDGQVIHKYRYKGDPRTQIGLIAQEVERHHPDAVGLARGYKTVNYDTATKDAANRGHFGYGGLAGRHGYGTDGAVRPEALPEWNEEIRRRIMRNEGTDLPNNAGYDARYGYDKYIAPDKPLSQMTLGEVSNYQRDKLIPATRGQIPGVPKTQGTGAVGAYQMTHGFINQYAPEFFGPNYRDETFFTPENQDALAEFVYNKYKNDPKKLAGTWATFSGLDPQGAGRALEVQQGRNTTNPDGSMNVARNTVGAPAAGLDPRGPAVMGEAPPIMAERPAGLAAAGLERPDAEAQKTGLAGAQEKPFGYPLRKRPDWMQRHQEWVLPLASGIGSMLASKSPFLAGAIGEGLVGAAGGYESGQQRLSEMEERAATTEKTFAEMAQNAIREQGGQVYITGYGPDGTLQSIPYWEWVEQDPKARIPLDPRTEQTARQRAEELGRPGGSAIPAALVDPNSPVKITPEIEDLMKARAKRALQMGRAVEDEPDVYTPQESIGLAARNQQPRLLELSALASGLPRGESLFQSGKFNEFRTSLAAYLSDIARAGGLRGVSSEDLADTETINKLIASLRNEATTDAGQTAFRAISEIGQAFPSLAATAGAQAKIMAMLMRVNQREIDKNQLFQQALAVAESTPYGKTVGRKTGTGLNEAFDRAYGPAFYTPEEHNMERMFNEGPVGADGNNIGPNGQPVPPGEQGVTWMQWLRANGKNLSREDRDVIEKEFGKGLLRYYGL